MENTKYIIANIKIPIEIQDNNIKYLNEYANVVFEVSDKLPEKTINDSDMQMSIQSLINMLHVSETIPNEQQLTDTQTDENEKIFLTIKNSEIKSSKKSTNTSFKNRRAVSTRYTRKV